MILRPAPIPSLAEAARWLIRDIDAPPAADRAEARLSTIARRLEDARRAAHDDAADDLAAAASAARLAAPEAAERVIRLALLALARHHYLTARDAILDGLHADAIRERDAAVTLLRLATGDATCAAERGLPRRADGDDALLRLDLLDLLIDEAWPGTSTLLAG